MLSYNVVGPAAVRARHVAGLPVRRCTELVIADDLAVAAPIRGTVRLANTGRGIIARGHLTTALPETLQPLPRGDR